VGAARSVRPPFAYYGGKIGMAARIVAVLPPHRVYMEPFFGSGAVLFAKPRASVEIVNDVSDRVVTFFRVLRDRPDDLARVCAMSPHARSEYRAAAAPADDELEEARRFWVRVNQSFGKTANVTTGWSITTSRNQSVPASIANRVARFHQVAERLSSVSIECCDAVDLVERLATSETTIYADPPYVWSTRIMRAAGARDYVHEFTDDDHRRLAASLRGTPAAVVLSGYPSDLYDELYHDWWTLDRLTTAASSNAHRTGRSSRIERLWTNRPPDTLWSHA
jgi:DNA adenine methylase